MILKTLELKDFRNYEQEEVVFHEKINILTGKNAQGKTNLIEAVNLLALGKSFRTRRDVEMVLFGMEGASVKGRFEKKDRPHTVEIRISAGTQGKKTYIVNGLETATVSDLFGGVFTIVFSPEDLRIVKGDPETRRRFLDRELILHKPLYYHILKKYRTILKTRNTVLKGENVLTKLLDVYDSQFSEAAADVMKERATWIEELSVAAAKAGREITGGREEISIEYRPSFSQPTREAIYETLLRGREKDIATRSTEAGPHRDDFSIFSSGLDLRVYGSQGQQRTAALSLRLAERELIKKATGEDAILLLDDVMSELDTERQEKLMESFGENQIFITAASPFREEAHRLDAVKVIRIENGKVY